MKTSLLPLSLLLLLSAGTVRDDDTGKLYLPDDLEATLWAESPMLFNPTSIDIDAQGRVYVAEGVNYRGKAGRRKEGDRIVVLEDTTGAGKADKVTVFLQRP
ncbi:MAG: hypothetical protein LH609_23900, partial [Rudanella sp.]|nr:hypothetical protein [Rudanella sp.]